VPVGLALALHPSAEMAHPGEPSSGCVAGVALADLDQPASDVLAVQVGGAGLRMVLSQPAGEAPHRVLVRLDGVVGVAVGPQRKLSGGGEHGEVRMTHADCYQDMERCA